MGFTLIAFHENVLNTTLDNVAALNDTKYFAVGDDFRVPEKYNKLILAYVLGDLTTRAQLTAPSLLKRAPMELVSIDPNAEPLSVPPLINMAKNPFQLSTAEALNALTTNSGTSAVDQAVGCWLADSIPAEITGKEIFTIRATGTTTATANAWSNGAMTLGSDLDPGTYALVGAFAWGATMKLARFIFTADETRPGCIAHDTNEDIGDPIFRQGRLGEWGRFQHDTPPRFEIFCVSADTAQTFVLDLMKVA